MVIHTVLINEPLGTINGIHIPCNLTDYRRLYTEANRLRTWIAVFFLRAWRCCIFFLSLTTSSRAHLCMSNLTNTRVGFSTEIKKITPNFTHCIAAAAAEWIFLFDRCQSYKIICITYNLMRKFVMIFFTKSRSDNSQQQPTVSKTYHVLLCYWCIRRRGENVKNGVSAWEKKVQNYCLTCMQTSSDSSDKLSHDISTC